MRRVALAVAAVALALLPSVAAAATAADDPVLAVDLALPAPTGPSVQIATSSTGPVTAKGRGRFSELAVTVSATQNLVHQVVSVSWTGGQPTQDLGSNLRGNYLQVMQCWGDDAGGPRREQCEFGAQDASRPLDGRDTRSRKAFVRPEIPGESFHFRDPKEKTYTTARSGPYPFTIPFWSPAAVANPALGPEYATTTLWNTTTSNEVPAALTLSDGTGSTPFEVQSTPEAPFLGCSTARPQADGSMKGLRCWLVVVPRGPSDSEPLSPGDEDYTGDQLDSGPLTQSNWDDRIVFPLDFNATEKSCPVGKDLVVAGQELASQAVARWRLALCGNGGTSFTYLKYSDSLARRRVTTTGELQLVSRPVDPTTLTAGATLVYAPVSAMPLTFAFILEKSSVGELGDAPPELSALNGQQVASLKLTPRLVAKLLTQSYRESVLRGDPAVAGNPADLQHDPEFQALNADAYPWIYNASTPIANLLVPGDPSDAAVQVWSWIDADPDARAFLNGTKDASGMQVNPAYLKISLPLETFPKLDNYTYALAGGATASNLNWSLWSSSYAEGARALFRGDPLQRTNFNNDTGTYGTTASRNPGQRTGVALSDASTAAIYGLPVASIPNAKGEFVTPTEASINLAWQTMKPVSGTPVALSDPRSPVPGAYPLLSLTYAATQPSLLTKDAGDAYATFIEYAATTGQTPGTKIGNLPYGYAPLTQALRVQAIQAAGEIRRSAGVKPAPSSTPSPTPTPSARPSAPAATPAPTASRPTPAPSVAISTRATTVTTPTPTSSAAANPAPATSLSPSPTARTSATAAPSTSPKPSTSPTSRPSSAGKPSGTTGSGVVRPAAPRPSTSPTARPSAATSSTPVPTTSTTPGPDALQTVAVLTSADPLPRGRYALVAVAALALLGLAAGPGVLALSAATREE